MFDFHTLLYLILRLRSSNTRLRKKAKEIPHEKNSVRNIFNEASFGPNTESLKLISKTFGVSVNTLLGSPRHLIKRQRKFRTKKTPCGIFLMKRHSDKQSKRKSFGK